jgi:hypothetical protein
LLLTKTRNEGINLHFSGSTIIWKLAKFYLYLCYFWQINCANRTSN